MRSTSSVFPGVIWSSAMQASRRQCTKRFASNGRFHTRMLKNPGDSVSFRWIGQSCGYRFVVYERGCTAATAWRGERRAPTVDRVCACPDVRDCLRGQVRDDDFWLRSLRKVSSTPRLAPCVSLQQRPRFTRYARVARVVVVVTVEGHVLLGHCGETGRHVDPVGVGVDFLSPRSAGAGCQISLLHARTGVAEIRERIAPSLKPASSSAARLPVGGCWQGKFWKAVDRVESLPCGQGPPQRKRPPKGGLFRCFWSGRQDLNLRLLRPERSALPG